MQLTATDVSRKRRRRYIIIALIAVGLALAAGFFLTQARNRGLDAVNAPTGETVEAFIGDLSASATASGQVEAVQSTELSAPQAGTVSDVLVSPGMVVEAGEPIVVLDQRDLLLQVERMKQDLTLKQAELDALLEAASAADIASAEAAVASARANLDDLLKGPTAEEIAELEANIRQQQAGVWSASAAYGSTADSVSASSLAAAEAELVSAQIAYDQARERNEDDTNGITHEEMLEAERDLNIAQTRVDELRAGPKQGSLSSASADISAAQANLAKSQAELETLLKGASPAQIASAEAVLAQSEADLADLLAGATEQDIAIAEAELAQAQLDLQNAEESLADATIVAPFDGLIVDILVTAGERASGTVAEIVSSQLQVVLGVDELDVGSLRLGQSATVTFEAFPGESLDGHIRSIAPSAGDTADGIVTYDVTVAFDSADLPILVGMTADAQLITAERAGVLLVPNAAITPNRRAGTYSVNLVIGEDDGEPIIESREVRIGLKDGNYTEIRSGITEGDTVMIGELAAPTIDFGRGFGGG